MRPFLIRPYESNPHFTPLCSNYHHFLHFFSTMEKTASTAQIGVAKQKNDKSRPEGRLFLTLWKVG